MNYPCNNCYSRSTECQKTCGAYLAYLRQLSVEAEIEQLESKLNKPILTTYTTTTLSPKNEPKRIMPLQVKESDFKNDTKTLSGIRLSNVYIAKINNWSFMVCVDVMFMTAITIENEKIKLDVVLKKKPISLPEAVTAINDYLKQLFEEAQE